MKPIFLSTVGLSWLNAMLVLREGMTAASTHALVVSIIVGTLFFLLGLLFFLIQHYLFRTMAEVRQTNGGARLGRPLAGLRNCLVASAIGLSLFMLICLTAIFSRFQEGYALFG